MLTLEKAATIGPTAREGVDTRVVENKQVVDTRVVENKQVVDTRVVENKQVVDTREGVDAPESVDTRVVENNQVVDTRVASSLSAHCTAARSASRRTVAASLTMSRF